MDIPSRHTSPGRNVRYLSVFLAISARALSSNCLPFAPLAVTSATQPSVTVWPTFFQASNSDLGMTLVVFLVVSF